MKSFNLLDYQHLALLAVGNALQDGDWNYGPINSSFTRIYYVYEGSAEVEMNGHTYSLTPGHLYIIPPFVTHFDRCAGTFNHFYVHFIDRKQKITRLFNAYDMPVEIDASTLDRKVHERLCELCTDMYLSNSHPATYETDSHMNDVTAKYDALAEPVKTEIYALLLVLFARFMQHARLRRQISDKRIEKTLQTIEHNILEPISIDQLAAEVSLCKDRFIRLFKLVVGETPGQYIMRQKIQQAQIMLSSTDMRVKEVAYALGFDSESYFDRVFFRNVNLSPTDFRRQNTIPASI